MRRGRRLGIDVGAVRIGVASCDPDGLLATPVCTLQHEASVPTRTIERLAQLVREQDAIEVIVGLPRRLDGSQGPAAQSARQLAGELAQAITPCPVRLVDERLSTVQAHSSLHAAGRPGRRHREVVDQVAAVVILQTALDTERSSGHPAGELIAVNSPADRKGAQHP